jgi:hypothetical protein
VRRLLLEGYEGFDVFVRSAVLTSNIPATGRVSPEPTPRPACTRGARRRVPHGVIVAGTLLFQGGRGDLRVAVFAQNLANRPW